MVSEDFGILKHQVRIEFNGGIIEPLPDSEETLSTVAMAVNPDGYLYPPTQHTVKEFSNGLEDIKEIVPQSERPAFLYFLPATHRVSVEQPLESDFRRGDGGFLIHLSAYLFGTRVQFEDWKVDGRIPINHRTHGAIVMPRKASAFFEAAYDTWRGWNADRRQRMTNTLYVHSRASSYEWLWEQFLMEYLAFDALWKQLALPDKGHGQRIEQVCSLLGLYQDNSAARQIVALRNNLMHEALWEGDTPGFSSGKIGWDCVMRLRSLNHKAIAASLGWQGTYTTSNWVNCSMTEFFR